MDHELTLVEHLNELRKRIIISLIALGIFASLSLPFADYGLKILKKPANGIIEKLAFFSPQEGFLIYLRIAFFFGLIASIPVILYQIWIFILPAIENKQRKYTEFSIFFCSAAFITGCAFAYFILIPPALKFLLNFAGEQLEPVISASKYISFVLSLILGCGLVFQMPVLSLILTKLRLINAGFLRKKYKYAIVVVFILAAIITPTPDAFNMLALALPMLLLYELSVWISFFAQPKVNQKNAVTRIKLL